MNNEELEEKKKWFFKENIRLEELRKNLEQQQGKLEKEEQVVEIQKQMLEKQNDKTEVVVTFLALLELMKVGKIHLTQEHLFDDMYIESLEPEGGEEDEDIVVTTVQ